jgi:hypothetical protein
MGSITRRLRSLFGKGDDARAEDKARDARTKDEDRAIEAVEADIVQSRDDAFTRMSGMPRSGDDPRY